MLVLMRAPTFVCCSRYDLGDDRYFWFDIPFRSDGFSFVRGDDGDGVSNEQVTSLPCADDHAGSQSNVPCTLLLDVGCSVVIAGGDPPEDVDTGRMWGVHLGMMKCILTMPSGGNTKASKAHSQPGPSFSGMKSTRLLIVHAKHEKGKVQSLVSARLIVFDSRC